MHNVSKSYKNAMSDTLRGRGYIKVGLGAINLEAQSNCVLQNPFPTIPPTPIEKYVTFWSNLDNIFNSKQNDLEYATFEQNFMKADGKMYIMPKESSFYDVGIVLNKDALILSFDKAYNIKGLSIDFGDVYPETVIASSSNGSVTIHPTSRNMNSDFNFGLTNRIRLGFQMNNPNQRVRLKTILIGLALTYSNLDVIDSNYQEFISPISEEVPSSSFDVTIADNENKYNVDSKDSVINFLEIGQNVSVSMGVDTSDKGIEWVKVCDLSLQSWESSKGKFSFTAVDKFANNNDKYTLGNRIYDRSAYTEITNILTDMGLTPSQYEIDNYLATVTLHNPLPEATHKECLQIIANACRCVFYQDSNGKIIVKTNLALVLEPDDIKIDVSGNVASWSKPENILIGAREVYGDFTRDFIKADGQTRIMPRQSNYLETGYVSKEISNSNGNFHYNPSITLEFKTALSYYGLNIVFDGNVPEELILKTFLDDELKDTTICRELEQKTFIDYEFIGFNKIQIIFTKTKPRNRVLVNEISFAYFNDYKLRLADMKEEPYGQRETTVKSISAKIFSYENDDKGKPKEVDDDIWYTINLNNVGQNLEVENQLIHSADMARDVCEWLGNYYKIMLIIPLIIVETHA